MRILFVVDGRSVIALNWIRYFISAGDEVYLVSTFPCTAEPGLAGMEILPVAFSGTKKLAADKLTTDSEADKRTQANGLTADLNSFAEAPDKRTKTDGLTVDKPPTNAEADKRTKANGGGGAAGGWLKDAIWGAGMVGMRTALRQWLGPLTLPRAAPRLREVVERLQPDLVHAMRIPYEGMLAALALAELPKVPLMVSVWGNDFTLHGRANPWMNWLTRRTLSRANALHTDCARDQHLAQEWGFAPGKPTIVLPGNGGIDLGMFYPPQETAQDLWVINPRGVRAYVRNDTFFQAIPKVLQELPETRFACLGMAGEALAQRWARELGIEAQVELLPKLPREQVADLFRRSAVAVSPTTHDGTPNTLLEAMACGCFPVVGDLESLREWINPGENGALVDPGDPAALAQAMVTALRQPELRRRALAVNTRLIAERAEYQQCMRQAQVFYRQLSGRLR